MSSLESAMHNQRARHLAVLVASLALAAATTVAVGQGRPAPLPEPLPPMPRLELPFPLARGEQAIAALGSRLPEVAAAHGLSAQQLILQLRFDASMHIDRNGRALYIEPTVPAPQGAGSGGAGSDPVVLAAPYPADQTFLLNSRPGASRTIYLDFDGHTASGTAWNNTYSPSAPIVSPAFDLDGVPGTFNTTELERIQYIWQRVAEDYAPFDVNVTTQDPGFAALNRSGSGDGVFGSRVVVTKDFTAAAGKACNCGGFAYLSVYDRVNNEYYQPAYVFYDKLGSGNEKYVAEAISHEAGHNLGLSHDGTATVGYYQGHGSGATGWAPIMGVGYYKELVQWSKGEYAGANMLQDDIAVIQSRGGPLRADDHGDSTGAATALSATPSGGLTALSGSGVIHTAADIDYFAFDAGAGNLTISVAPAAIARSSNLDAGMDLLDSAGRVIASAAPAATLNATISTALPAPGRYYLVVGGLGNGDPLGTGYTDYGSLGQYVITGTAQPMTGSPPVAVATASATSGTVPLAVSFTGANSYDPDGTIASYAWDFGNGQSASTANASTTYTAAGTFTARLTVTDNDGLTATRAVQVQASNPVTTAPMSVSGIAMSVTVARNGTAGVAAVTVRDASGNVVPGASVAGRWSGVVTGAATATTGSNGTATFTSPRTKKRGTATFTVTGITLSGYAYDAAGNTISSSSISW
jgi:PKD repeat protein